MHIIKKIKNIIVGIPLILWIIFLIGITIRFVGINYGLPLQLNIDEPTTISTSINLKHNLNPDRFDWPHLYFYVNAALYAIFSVFRSILDLFVHIDSLYTPSALFLISRVFTAILGALTIISTYFIGKELFKSQRAAYIAAFLMAILPVHVEESHFAKLDVAQAFVISIAFYFIIRLYNTSQAKYYLFSGIFIGIATSVKYNAFLMAVPFVLAILLNAKSYKDVLNRFVIANSAKAILLSLLFFYLGTPFALIDFQTFWSAEHAKGALWQFQNVGSVIWAEYPAALYETFVPMYKGDLGFGLWVLFSLLLILFLFFNKRSKPYVLTLLPVLVISLYISHFDRSPSHYFLFLTPMYVPAIAYFITEISEWIQLKVKLEKNLILALTLILAIAPSFISTIKISYLYSVKDTRAIAAEWVKSNLNENVDTLYVYGEPLESVPFQKNNSTRLKRIDTERVIAPPFYILVGDYGVSREEILGGDRDPENIEGNSQAILQNAEIVFTIEEEGRLGPPIYIFKVNQFGEK